jgi:hypothetical protein
MRIKLDPGTEKWLPFAKTKLKALRARLTDQNAVVLNQRFLVESGITIFIQAWRDGLDEVRIAGTAAFGWLLKAFAYDDGPGNRPTRELHVVNNLLQSVHRFDLTRTHYPFLGEESETFLEIVQFFEDDFFWVVSVTADLQRQIFLFGSLAPKGAYVEIRFADDEQPHQYIASPNKDCFFVSVVRRGSPLINILDYYIDRIDLTHTQATDGSITTSFERTRLFTLSDYVPAVGSSATSGFSARCFITEDFQTINLSTDVIEIDADPAYDSFTIDALTGETNHFPVVFDTPPRSTLLSHVYLGRVAEHTYSVDSSVNFFELFGEELRATVRARYNGQEIFFKRGDYPQTGGVIDSLFVFGLTLGGIPFNANSCFSRDGARFAFLTFEKIGISDAGRLELHICERTRVQSFVVKDSVSQPTGFIPVTARFCEQNDAVIVSMGFEGSEGFVALYTANEAGDYQRAGIVQPTSAPWSPVNLQRSKNNQVVLTTGIANRPSFQPSLDRGAEAHTLVIAEDSALSEQTGSAVYPPIVDLSAIGASEVRQLFMRTVDSLYPNDAAQSISAGLIP